MRLTAPKITTRRNAIPKDRAWRPRFVLVRLGRFVDGRRSLMLFGVYEWRWSQSADGIIWRAAGSCEDLNKGAHP